MRKNISQRQKRNFGAAHLHAQRAIDARADFNTIRIIIATALFIFLLRWSPAYRAADIPKSHLQKDKGIFATPLPPMISHADMLIFLLLAAAAAMRLLQKSGVEELFCEVLMIF